MRLTLYVSKEDEPVLRKLQARLDKERRSLSEFFMESGRKHLGMPTIHSEMNELRRRIEVLERGAE
jgi:hypothetical protein